MPTYSYRCTQCDNAFDIQQSFTDENLTVCPVCGGVLRKVFSPIGVSFTGSGFYRNDSRAQTSSSEGAKKSGGSESRSGSGSGSAAGEKKSETKPASDSKPATPSAPASSSSSSSSQ